MVPAMLGDLMSVLSATAIILNFVLLPLIAFKSGKDIGSYKVLLFFYSCVAIIHTTVTLLLVPVFEPSEKGWLFYATVPRVGREFGSWLFCIFATCYMKLLLILTYSFVYRYFVMCSPQKLIWFHQLGRIITLVFLYLVIIFCCAGPVYSYMRLNAEIAASFNSTENKQLEDDLYVELDKVAYIGSPMMRNGHIVMETAYILMVYTIAILCSTAVCFFCIVRIIQAFRNTARIAIENTSFHKLQQRLFILLVLQTMVPLIFTFIPALLSYVLAYLGTHAPIMSQVSSAFMPMAQLIDPILIFTFIGEYRRGLKSIFKMIVSRQTSYTAPIA